MFCLIIRKTNGNIIRKTMDSRPTLVDIEYWENYYTDNCHCANSAVVVNVYEIED